MTSPVMRAPVYYPLGSVRTRGVDTELSRTFDDMWLVYACYAYWEAWVHDVPKT